jgi:hypothetical protein
MAARPAPTPPFSSSHQRGWRMGGVVFGGLLVCVGLFVLFGGVGSIFDLFRLWPLLIVAGGLATMFNPRGAPLVKRIAEGLGSVTVGFILLGITIGPLRWTVWFALLALWPLLLVAIGIELAGRGLHANWLRALSNVVIIAGMLYGVFVLAPAPGRVAFPFSVSIEAGSAFSQSVPHDPLVTAGRAAIKVGATRLTLKGGESLASITGRAPAGDRPTLAASTPSGTADVVVSNPGDRAVFIPTSDRSLDVSLDQAVTWSELRFDLGAVAADADLSALRVERVLVNMGASDLRIKIGSLSGKVAVDVNGGATALTLLVPAGSACTVNSTSGLSDIRVPSSFVRTSGIVILGSSTFVQSGTGGPAISVSLTSGVSDLRVETY